MSDHRLPAPDEFARTMMAPKLNGRGSMGSGRHLGQSQLMERTMLCPRITQQSLRKPLDAGCFEGYSTRAGPKPPVQLYDRDHCEAICKSFDKKRCNINVLLGNGVTVAQQTLTLFV